MQTTPDGIRIYGNLQADDDYTHELGPEPNFNESVYFNFFDPVQNRGGFVRIGNRANEGYAEMTVIVWNPDGSAWFNYAKPAISDNAQWHAGGLQIEIIQPVQCVRTTFSGDTVYLADPRDMQDPSSAFKNNAHQTLRIDLRHDAVGPMYGHVGDPEDGNQFARAHTEQHMRVAGTIQVGEEAPLDFSGWGLRDHSWGPRFWQATPSYRWITGNFGDDLGMIVRTNRDGQGGGLFHEGQELVRITKTELTTDYEPNSNFHKTLSAQLTLEDGRSRVLRGEVISYIPLRNRRSGAHTHVGEGMTRYTLDDDRVGYGLSEYLDNPDS